MIDLNCMIKVYIHGTHVLRGLCDLAELYSMIYIICNIYSSLHTYDQDLYSYDTYDLDGRRELYVIFCIVCIRPTDLICMIKVCIHMIYMIYI